MTILYIYLIVAAVIFVWCVLSEIFPLNAGWWLVNIVTSIGLAILWPFFLSLFIWEGIRSCLMKY
jgi:hypothetical protein